jgi:hypothetical protein
MRPLYVANRVRSPPPRDVPSQISVEKGCVETRLPILFSEGVVKERIDLHRLKHLDRA